MGLRVKIGESLLHEEMFVKKEKKNIIKSIHSLQQAESKMAIRLLVISKKF